MNEKATLVVTATPNPHEMEAVKDYLQEVLPLLLGAGGKPVKRLKVDELIHGTPCGMVLVMDFDSNEAINNLFESEEYAALIPVRNQGFIEMNILSTHEM